MLVLISKLESPVSILPQQQVNKVIDSLKAYPAFKELPDSVGLKMVEDLLKTTLRSKTSDDEKFREVAKKLKKNYPELNYTIAAFDMSSPKTTAIPDDDDHTVVIEYERAYKPVKYQIVILNIFEVVMREIYGIFIFSLLYLLFSASAVILLIRNIIERRRFIQMKTDLTNNMTHELKTPIAILYSAAEALDDYNMINEKDTALNYIRFMKTGLMRLNRMAESILYFSLIDENKINLVEDKIVLNEFFFELERQFHPLFKERNAEFSYHSPDGSIFVKGDKEYLNIVFSNLIDNALKYNSNEPVITITAENSGSHTKILFEDNGMGIPEKFQKNIFNAYHRGTSGDKSIKGYGIGLSYAKQIIKLHGGTIELLYSQPGKGSVFQIVLKKYSS